MLCSRHGPEINIGSVYLKGGLQCVYTCEECRPATMTSDVGVFRAQLKEIGEGGGGVLVDFSVAPETSRQIYVISDVLKGALAPFVRLEIQIQPTGGFESSDILMKTLAPMHACAVYTILRLRMLVQRMTKLETYCGVAGTIRVLEVDDHTYRTNFNMFIKACMPSSMRVSSVLVVDVKLLA